MSDQQQPDCKDHDGGREQGWGHRPESCQHGVRHLEHDMKSSLVGAADRRSDGCSSCAVTASLQLCFDSFAPDCCSPSREPA